MSISRFATMFIGDDWIFFKKSMSNPQISSVDVVDVRGWIMRWRRQLTLLISSKFLQLRSIQVQHLRMDSGDPLWSRSETSRKIYYANENNQVQWGSKYQTCPAFKWSKHGRIPNGLDFKCFNYLYVQFSDNCCTVNIPIRDSQNPVAFKIWTI